MSAAESARAENPHVAEGTPATLMAAIRKGHVEALVSLAPPVAVVESHVVDRLNQVATVMMLEDEKLADPLREFIRRVREGT